MNYSLIYKPIRLVRWNFALDGILQLTAKSIVRHEEQFLPTAKIGLNNIQMMKFSPSSASDESGNIATASFNNSSNVLYREEKWPIISFFAFAWMAI